MKSMHSNEQMSIIRAANNWGRDLLLSPLGTLATDRDEQGQEITAPDTSETRQDCAGGADQQEDGQSDV